MVHHKTKMVLVEHHTNRRVHCKSSLRRERRRRSMVDHTGSGVGSMELYNL